MHYTLLRELFVEFRNQELIFSTVMIKDVSHNTKIQFFTYAKCVIYNNLSKVVFSTINHQFQLLLFLLFWERGHRTC